MNPMMAGNMGMGMGMNPLMMNPMMMGGNPMMGGLSPQFTGFQNPWGAPPPQQMQMMIAQQAAAQAYHNAMMTFSQAGSVAGSEIGGPTAGGAGSGPMRAQSPMMWGAGPVAGNPMSMYGGLQPQMTGATSPWGMPMGMGMGGMGGMNQMGMMSPMGMGMGMGMQQPDFSNSFNNNIRPGSPSMRASMFGMQPMNMGEQAQLSTPLQPPPPRSGSTPGTPRKAQLGPNSSEL
jgi:CCR4-NOT transcriptional complex subunit CAF120